MSEFNTSKNKLRKIWQRIEKNNSEIQNKDNVGQLEFFINLLKQQNIKNPIEIFNSGDINLISNTNFNDNAKGIFTVFKGEKMPTQVSYSENIDLQIPEIFLPFVKYSVEINPLPDSEIHNFVLYDKSNFRDDSVKIQGDGTLIFTSDKLPTENTTIGGSGIDKTFPDSYFTDNNISFDFSKKVFKGTITKNDDSIKFGNVIALSTTVVTALGSGNCLNSNNTEVFTVKNLQTPDHKIISISSTSFTAVGDFTVTTFTDTGSSCDQIQVVTTNVTKTFTFSAVNSYTITLDNLLTIQSSTIKSQEFEENNRWLFWSTLKQKLFQLIVVRSDGDFKEIGATNFPHTSDGDTLPYNSITLKRNIIDTPDEGEKESISLKFKRAVFFGRIFKNYIKISESNASIPTFRFKLAGGFIILSSSIIPIITDFPVYDDIYTVVGNTYIRTIIDHTILSKTTFSPETQDVTITIKAYLVNPLYWREQRRYNKNDF